ncbi:uncharacterized protein LOC124814116 [Hydra vulgaris]|uniref:uncharacterized protein LOC124814116 n=1 Tax=Hydra vulgaris TaxID=6087 RepID=UPI001F5E6DD0|nr:uncharacterized protein LOC124814116 [Hydra vulgaris]
MEQNKYFYESCCCFSKGNCGSFKKHKIINKTFYIHQLGDVDVKKHLINLKVMRLNDNNIWEENGLIANRLKRNLEKDEQVCAFLRYTFGIVWSPPKTSFHPHHLNIKGKKSPALRASPIHVVISMSKRYNEVFSVGAMLCFTHLKQETALSRVNENTNLCTETQTQQEQTYVTPATPDEEFDPGEIPEKKVFVRSSLDQTKCEHFLDFIFTSGILHDVAYGITKLKYDSGEEQKIVHAILTAKYSHAIMFYRKSCSENNYIPLSDSSLWKVLHAIKPSRRKSLAGLDDVTASGMNGFQTLQKLAQRFSSKSLEAALEKGKRYLKTSYQINCSVNDSNISSHSSKHALSDPSEKNLQSNTEISEVICADCYDFSKAIEMIKELTTQNSDDADSIYDLEIAVKDVFNYIKHLILNRKRQKSKLLSN